MRLTLHDLKKWLCFLYIYWNDYKNGRDFVLYNFGGMFSKEAFVGTSWNNNNKSK